MTTNAMMNTTRIENFRQDLLHATLAARRLVAETPVDLAAIAVLETLAREPATPERKTCSAVPGTPKSRCSGCAGASPRTPPRSPAGCSRGTDPARFHRRDWKPQGSDVEMRQD